MHFPAMIAFVAAANAVFVLTSGNAMDTNAPCVARPGATLTSVAARLRQYAASPAPVLP